MGLVLSGFTSMIYETGWIRVLTLVVGGSTYAFTWIVCSFMLGIALGSFWVSRRPESDDLRLFGWLQVGVVVTGVDEDCITFTDEIAKNGLKATLQNVPYPTIDIH